MWDRKLELKERYDSAVSHYNQRYREIQRKKFQAVRKDLEGAGRILDIGCGTGLFLEVFSGSESFSIGVDFSMGMLREARKSSASWQLVQADADKLPFPDGSFDTVVSFTLLQNMPDPEDTIKEMARVVDRGGKVIVTVLGKKHKAEDVENWMTAVNLNPQRVEKIPDSEDFLCVGRR